MIITVHANIEQQVVTGLWHSFDIVLVEWMINILYGYVPPWEIWMSVWERTSGWFCLPVTKVGGTSKHYQERIYVTCFLNAYLCELFYLCVPLTREKRCCYKWRYLSHSVYFCEVSTCIMSSSCALICVSLLIFSRPSVFITRQLLLYERLWPWSWYYHRCGTEIGLMRYCIV